MPFFCLSTLPLPRKSQPDWTSGLHKESPTGITSLHHLFVNPNYEMFAFMLVTCDSKCEITGISFSFAHRMSLWDHATYLWLHIFLISGIARNIASGVVD